MTTYGLESQPPMAPMVTPAAATPQPAQSRVTPTPAAQPTQSAAKTQPAAKAKASASTAEGAYVIKTGDTLTAIAKAHSTTVKALKEANGLTSDNIVVGRKLKIPAAKTVAVTF